jgi:hypothetical protein
MAHRLEPRKGRPYLDPEEVVRRLRDEFVHCEADADAGADITGDMIAKLIELKAPQEIIDAAVAGRERALRITVADDAATDDYLSFVVQPDEGPFIGYYSAQHEAATRPLLERCARTLGYKIILV